MATASTSHATLDDMAHSSLPDINGSIKQLTKRTYALFSPDEAFRYNDQEDRAYVTITLAEMRPA